MDLLKEQVGILVEKHGSYRGAGQIVGVDWSYMKRLHDGSMTNPSQAVCEKLGLKKTVSVEFELIDTAN